MWRVPAPPRPGTSSTSFDVAAPRTFSSSSSRRRGGSAAAGAGISSQQQQERASASVSRNVSRNWTFVTAPPPPGSAASTISRASPRPFTTATSRSNTVAGFRGAPAHLASIDVPLNEEFDRCWDEEQREVLAATMSSVASAANPFSATSARTTTTPTTTTVELRNRRRLAASGSKQEQAQLRVRRVPLAKIAVSHIDTGRGHQPQNEHHQHQHQFQQQTITNDESGTHSIDGSHSVLDRPFQAPPVATSATATAALGLSPAPITEELPTDGPSQQQSFDGTEYGSSNNFSASASFPSASSSSVFPSPSIGNRASSRREQKQRRAAAAQSRFAERKDHFVRGVCHCVAASSPALGGSWPSPAPVQEALEDADDMLLSSSPKSEALRQAVRETSARMVGVHVDRRSKAEVEQELRMKSEWRNVEERAGCFEHVPVPALRHREPAPPPSEAKTQQRGSRSKTAQDEEATAVDCANDTATTIATEDGADDADEKRGGTVHQTSPAGAETDGKKEGPPFSASAVARRGKVTFSAKPHVGNDQSSSSLSSSAPMEQNGAGAGAAKKTSSSSSDKGGSYSTTTINGGGAGGGSGWRRLRALAGVGVLKVNIQSPTRPTRDRTNLGRPDASEYERKMEIAEQRVHGETAAELARRKLAPYVRRFAGVLEGIKKDCGFEENPGLPERLDALGEALRMRHVSLLYDSLHPDGAEKYSPLTEVDAASADPELLRSLRHKKSLEEAEAHWRTALGGTFAGTANVSSRLSAWSAVPAIRRAPVAGGLPPPSTLLLPVVSAASATTTDETVSGSAESDGEEDESGDFWGRSTVSPASSEEVDPELELMLQRTNAEFDERMQRERVAATALVSASSTNISRPCLPSSAASSSPSSEAAAPTVPSKAHTSPSGGRTKHDEAPMGELRHSGENESSGRKTHRSLALSGEDEPEDLYGQQLQQRPRPLLLTSEALVRSDVRIGGDFEEPEVLVRLAQMHQLAVGDLSVASQHRKQARVIL